MRVTPVECPTQVATPAPSQVRREFAATQEGSDPKATSAQNGAHTPWRLMDLRSCVVVVVVRSSRGSVNYEGVGNAAGAGTALARL